MALDLQSLDPTTRGFMLRELSEDIASATVYLSPRLTETGRSVFPDLMRQAIDSGDDDSLADDLRAPGILHTTETRTRNGKTFSVKVRRDAPEMLARNEFNRFYIRGACLRVVEGGGGEVEIYRARQSSQVRPESESVIGTRVDAFALLEDLRTHKGTDPSLLPYVNSGLSVRLLAGKNVDPAAPGR